MRKPDFCIYAKTKAQHDYRAADQRLFYRYIDSSNPLLPRYEILICGCIAWFVSHVAGNSKTGFLVMQLIH